MFNCEPFDVEFEEDDNLDVEFDEGDELNVEFGEIQSGGGGITKWSQLLEKPFETIGENLKVVNGVLSVDTAEVVEEDNTKPITSAAVYTEVGNIAALLAAI